MAANRRLAAELAEMPEKQRQETLLTIPNDFFLSLKDVPNSLGSELYKDFPRRWEAAEGRVKELEELVKTIEYADNSVEEDRYEIASELCEKAMQGFEIYDEHFKRRIPFGHRLVLEARLLLGMYEAFARIENLLKNIYGMDRHEANLERQDLRVEIRLLDMMYTEVHTFFLKSYLDMDW